MTHRLDNMKQQRDVAGLTVTGIAKKANVSDLTVTTAENGGAIDINASQRIADALGVSLATLGKKDL